MAKQPRVLGETQGDDRVRRETNIAVATDDRALADTDRTQDDGTMFTAGERRRFNRDEFKQEALPTPPEMPGYHLCWLSTTNSYDPIHKRIRMGYEPVKAEEIPGFESFKLRGGEWEGAVSCNEMVLFKIPVELYLEIMAEFHHHAPIEEEESIRDRVRAMNADEDRDGKQLGSVQGDGFDTIVKKTPRAPSFQI